MTRRSPNICAPIGDRDEPRAPVALLVQSARAWSGESHALFRGFHWPVWNIRKSPPQSEITVNRVAEKPGFEPGRRLSHPTPLAGEPLRPLGYFSICIWRRERDSNPRCLSTSLVFKTSAINHSAISPCKPANMIISDAEEVVNIYALFFCRNRQSFLGMVLPEGKAPLPHR